MKTLLAWTAIVVSCLFLPYHPGSMEIWALAVLGLLTAILRFLDSWLLRDASFHGWQVTNRQRLQHKHAARQLRKECRLYREFVEAFVTTLRVDQVLEDRANTYELACKNQREFYRNLRGIQVPGSNPETVAAQAAQTFEGMVIDEHRWREVVQRCKDAFWGPHDLVGKLIEARLLDKKFAVREGDSFTKYLPSGDDAFEACGCHTKEKGPDKPVLAEGANEQPGQ